MDFFLALILLLVLFVGFLIFNRAPPLPPGVPSLPRIPIFGSLFQLPNGTGNFYDWHYEWTQKLGKTWSLSIFSASYVNILTADPKIVEYILKTNFDNFEKGPEFRRQLQDLLGNGIFNIDGDDWYKQRKVSSHIFSINNFKLNMMAAFLQHGKTFVDILNNVKTGEVIDMQNLFFRYTLASFCQIAFGIDIKAMQETPPFAQCFDFAQGRCSIRFITPFWSVTELFSKTGRKMRESIRTINTLALDVIHARKEQLKKDPTSCNDRDLLGLFLALKDDKGEPLANEYLRDVVMNFILAGRDTTAGALSWLLWELSSHPDVEEKMREEMRQVFGGREPTYEDMHKLSYTQAVISETLRLHPSVPVDLKTAVKDDVLPGGIKIKAGTAVNYLIYAMGRDPDIWENPLKFDPERFVKRPAESVSMYEYPVFNAGPRTCLGRNMASLEMKAVLAQIIPKFSFKVAPGASGLPTFPSITLSFRDGLPMTVTRCS